MKNKKGDAGLVVSLMLVAFVLFIFLSGLIFYMGLIFKTTENGQHTGTVTAIETNGLIFKTDSIYFKSDISSSQEDRYCVYDKNIRSKLEQYARDRTKITIIYEDYMIRGWKYCKMEDNGLIIGIKEVMK